MNVKGREPHTPSAWAACPEYRALAQAVCNDREDLPARAALCDWLEERGLTAAAKLHRLALWWFSRPPQWRQRGRADPAPSGRGRLTVRWHWLAVRRGSLVAFRVQLVDRNIRVSYHPAEPRYLPTRAQYARPEPGWAARLDALTVRQAQVQYRLVACPLAEFWDPADPFDVGRLTGVAIPWAEDLLWDFVDKLTARQTKTLPRLTRRGVVLWSAATQRWREFPPGTPLPAPGTWQT